VPASITGWDGSPSAVHASASAASVAGLRKRAPELRARRVVCVLTGAGLKDPDVARSLAGELIEVDATADAVRSVLASR
jgi:threonine synthase